MPTSATLETTPPIQIAPSASTITSTIGDSCASMESDVGFSTCTLPLFMKVEASMKKMMRRNAMSPIDEVGTISDILFLRRIIP